VSTVNPIPDQYPGVTPHLSIAGAADAIDFCTSVIGANEHKRMAMPEAQSPTPRS
jgi:PhnB protein